MEKLKQKLSSRKLWAAIIAVIVVLAVSLLGEELTPEIVSALECVVGAAVAYIFGEGAVDIARIVAEAVKRAYAAAYEVVGEVSSAEKTKRIHTAETCDEKQTSA